MPVRIDGKSIAEAPHLVDVVVSDPGVATQRLLARGGKRKVFRQIEQNGREVPHVVSLDETTYMFSTPQDWQRTTGAQVETGDVIYHLLFNSAKERESFIAEHGLTKSQELTGRDGSQQPLYTSGTTQFFLLATKVHVYTCDSHPAINVSESGMCPICGKKLNPVEAYR